VKNAVTGFGAGFLVPLHGLQMILTYPRVRRLAIIPFVLTFIVFIIGSFFGLPALTHLIPFIAQNGILAVGLTTGTAGFSLFYWLIVILAWPVAIFALLAVLFVLSRLIATPFYALLAEQVLIERKIKPDLPFRLHIWLKTSALLMVVALIKALIFGVVGSLLFLMSFIPGIGLISAFGFLLLTAFDVVDLSMEAMQLGLQERYKLFRDDFPAFVGLAVAMGLVFLVPGLNFFLFPASIAGGSEVIRRQKLMNGATSL
jgi:uncharacterized protein involved in cysteine biosynthesis